MNMQANGFQLRWLEELTEGEAPHTDWCRLLEQSQSDSIFLRPEWLGAWQKTLGRHESVRYGLAYSAQKLIVAGAFAQRGRAVVFAGSGPSDYSGLLFNRNESPPTHAIASLFDAATKAFPKTRYFRLGRIRKDSVLRQSLQAGVEGYRGVGLSSVPAPQFSMSRAGSLLRKKSLRRRQGALERIGQVRIRTLTDQQAITQALPTLFDLHRRRWKNAGKTSQFERAEERQFFEALPQAFASHGSLRLTEVLCADRVVAVHLGFCYGGVFTWYKPCFDPEFARYSPGELLLKALIERAQHEHCEVFDFTIGAEAFKLRFADSTPEVEVIAVTSSKWLWHALRLRRWFKGIRD